MKFICICVYSVISGVFADADEVKSVSVMEGDTVTLQNNVTDMKDVTDMMSDVQILWMFGLQGFLIAEMDREINDIVLHDGADGRFRDRLLIDHHTGSLTIRNIRTEHTGLYKVQVIRSRGISYKRFNVTVYGG